MSVFLGSDLAPPAAMRSPAGKPPVPGERPVTLGGRQVPAAHVGRFVDALNRYCHVLFRGAAGDTFRAALVPTRAGRDPGRPAPAGHRTSPRLARRASVPRAARSGPVASAQSRHHRQKSDRTRLTLELAYPALTDEVCAHSPIIPASPGAARQDIRARTRRPSCRSVPRWPCGAVGAEPHRRASRRDQLPAPVARAAGSDSTPASVRWPCPVRRRHRRFRSRSGEVAWWARLKCGTYSGHAGARSRARGGRLFTPLALTVFVTSFRGGRTR